MKKLISLLLVCALCISLLPMSAFAATKKDPKLVKAIENTFDKDGKLRTVTTLEKTLKLYPKNEIADLHSFQGGLDLCVRGKVKYKEVFDINNILKAGGKLEQVSMGGGDPAVFYHCLHEIKKDGVSYGTYDLGSYALNTVDVRKGSTEKEIKSLIKDMTREYYSSKNWTVTVEKFKKGNKNNPKDSDFYIDMYKRYQESTGYEKYAKNTYLLKIKNKNYSKKKGWAFVTVVPKLERMKTLTVSVKNLKSTADIKVTWKKRTQADKYEVWRKVGSNGKYKKIATTKKLSYRDKTTKGGKKYYYKVKAISVDNPTINSKFNTGKSIICK